MKSKRYTTEEKIRILREADRGEKSIQDLCRDENLLVLSFHRWKKQFGHMEVNEARRLKELERENTELKKMLADGVAGSSLSDNSQSNPTTIAPPISNGGATASAGARVVSKGTAWFGFMVFLGFVGFVGFLFGKWESALSAFQCLLVP